MTLTETAPAPTAAASGRTAGTDQPWWARPALFAITAVAGVLYARGIRNGQLHGYYAPAVKSMSESWRAFFYGGYDPAASITLDKLPGAFQVEALSARIFGFHTWSVLLPQVIETVIAILVLYRVVRRWLGPGAGLLAAAAFASTPIVAALAHAEISDTLLTMLLILAADAWQRAVVEGRLRWLLLSGVWVGLAFQAKMVQAWGVLPALAIGYLIAAPGPVRRRLAHVGLAGVATAVVSLSWITMVQLTPASARPYVDGSLDNSPFAMVFEYNLLSRYGVSSETTPGFGGPGGNGTWGFMIADGVASQVGWLYPMALLGLVAGIWLRGRAPRTDLVRAGFVMWGLWLAVHAVAFSTGRVAHSFYAVAIAPAIAALAGGGLVVLWRAYRQSDRPSHRLGDRLGGRLGGRQRGWRRWLLPAAVALSVAWAVYLSGHFATFLPWLRPVLVVLGLVSVLGLLLRARLAVVGGVVAVVALFLAPTAWASSTVDSQYAGSAIAPAAGPAGEFGPGGRGPAGPGAGPGGGPRYFRGGPVPGGGPGGFAGGTTPSAPGGTTPSAPGGAAPSAPGGAASSALIAWLKGHQPGSQYLLAVPGSMQAGQYILAGASVLPMGGFSGQVPFPTANQIAQLVAEGKLRYVLIGGSDGGPGRGGKSPATTWVTANCTPVSDSTVPTSGLYDCARS